MSMNWDAISNPQPPQDEAASKPVPLSNSDFRKLLLSAESQKTSKDASAYSMLRSRSDRNKTSSKSRSKSRPYKNHDRKHRRGEDGAAGEGTEGKKPESAPKYRDRARERREGKVVSKLDVLDPAVTEDSVEVAEEQEDEHDELMRTADYRAVAPTTSSSYAADRKRAIEESKYFGGDMENTHRVKGLDYVLLEKVRREIQNKEMEAEQQLDAELDRPLDEVRSGRMSAAATAASIAGLQFKSRMAEKIIEVLFKNKADDGKVERNEFFQPGRMAYRVELEEEMAEFEVPATVIRSKADCPMLEQVGSSNDDLTTSEIVINKLAQIFAYTRAGRRQAKKAKSAKQKVNEVSEYGIHPIQQDLPKKKPQPIFEDAPTEYVPTRRSRDHHRDRERDRDGHHHRHEGRHRDGAEQDVGRRTSHRDREEDEQRAERRGGATQATSGSRYFDKNPLEEEGAAVAGPADTKSALAATKEFIHQLASKFPSSSAAAGGKASDEQAHLERLLKKTEISGYDECYPGFAESYDAMGDSDEETDFSKMDMGNKKGPVGRWDFETQEEYGEYMSSREALPRAAYQYGVKKPEGRKTRRIGGGGGGANQKEDKAKVDRQLQQITSLINERKRLAQEAAGGGAASKKIKF